MGDIGGLLLQGIGTFIGFALLALVVFWFIQDSVLLHVPTPKPLAAGKHHVLLTLHLYPPYIPMLTHVTRGDAALLAA